MMQQKALLFGDSATADLIMLTKCPKEKKRLGRTVCKFNQSIWDEYSIAIVHQENYNKFKQNMPLLNKLQATVDTTLVEASPHDYTWGIGLGECVKRSQKGETWLRQNKLGQILTELRDNVFLEFQTLTKKISHWHLEKRKNKNKNKNRYIELTNLDRNMKQRSFHIFQWSQINISYYLYCTLHNS